MISERIRSRALLSLGTNEHGNRFGELERTINPPGHLRKDQTYLKGAPVVV